MTTAHSTTTTSDDPDANLGTADIDVSPLPPGRLVRRPAGWLRSHPLRWAAAILVVVIAPGLWSYGHALTRPGTSSTGIRTTEWVKEHGGRGLVAWAENTWYSHHKPKRGGMPAAAQLPIVTAPRATSPVSPAPATPAAPATPVRPTTTIAPVDAPAAPRLIVTPALPDEGVWQPAGRMGADGRPLLYTTFMRPDDVHTSLVTGLAWMDPTRLRFDLYSGSDEPGGPGWQLQAPLPFEVRPGLVGAFNSGFKLADSHGGYFAEGRQAPDHPLLDGQASLIVRKDGSATVGMWGRDAKMGPDIQAVRQNLVMLIDGGEEAPDLDVNSLAKWGYTVKNATLVWRSGVGVDAQGHLIYAAGNGLSVHSLADVLLAAGAVRAMELDINSEWVDFYSFNPDAAAPGGVVGTKLIPDMRPPADKYFKPSGRDFVTAFERPAGSRLNLKRPV